MVDLPFPSHVRLLGPIGVSIVLAFAVVDRPSAAVAIAAIIVMGFVFARLPARAALLAVLIYLPVEESVLTFVPSRFLLGARALPELIVAAVASRELLRARGRVRGGGLAYPILAIGLLWLVSGLSNGLAISTIAIGMRAELRFVLLALIVVCCDDLNLAGRVVALGVYIGGVIQAGVVIAEALIGAPLSRVLAPHWDLSLGGTSFAQGGGRTNLAYGTFDNRNTLGIYLLSALIVTMASRGQLGLPRKWLAGSVALIGAAIALSGSREGAIAAAVAVLIALALRLRQHSFVLFAGVIAAAVGLWATVGLVKAAPAPKSPSSLSERWTALTSAQSWSPTYHGNFRLFLLDSNVQLVWHEHPGLGFGLGSVTDRRSLADGTNPLFRTFAGKKAIEFNYQYDSNWALLVVEVGLIGCAALCAFLFWVIGVGYRLRRAHWSGEASMLLALTLLVLGFSAPVLQLRASSAICWCVFGLLCSAASTMRIRGPERG